MEESRSSGLADRVEVINGMHYFSKKSFFQPTSCSVCGKLIVEVNQQGLFCPRCHMNIHTKCMSAADHLFPCSKNSLNNTANMPGFNKTASDNTMDVNMNKLNTGFTHEFNLCTFSRPVHCKICKKTITGLYKQGLKCSNCKAIIHHTCLKLENSTAQTGSGAGVSNGNANNFDANMKAKIKVKVNGNIGNVSGSLFACVPSRKSDSLLFTNINNSSTVKNIMKSVTKKTMKGIKKVRKQLNNLYLTDLNYYGKSKTLDSYDLESIQKIEISTPSNFSHVSGTSKHMNLISLEEAKLNEQSRFNNSNGIDNSFPDSGGFVHHDQELPEYESPEAEDNLNNSDEDTIDEEDHESVVKQLGNGWVRLYDEDSKNFYYHNKDLNVTQWESPF